MHPRMHSDNIMDTKIDKANEVEEPILDVEAVFDQERASHLTAPGQTLAERKNRLQYYQQALQHTAPADYFIDAVNKYFDHMANAFPNDLSSIVSDLFSHLSREKTFVNQMPLNEVEKLHITTIFTNVKTLMDPPATSSTLSRLHH